jgi:hypothetical protein
MSLRPILLGTASIVSAATLISAAAGACDDDRYLCEPRAPAATSAPDIQQALRGATQVRRIATHAKAGRHRTVAKAPSGERSLQPMPDRNILDPGPDDAGHLAGVRAVAPVPFIHDNMFSLNRAARGVITVRVVSPDEFNEVDRAAPPPVQRSVATLEIPETTGSTPPSVSAEQNQAPADVSLLERVMITFGGAFGAASALRMFIG